jgi:23S rRNA pseudouridine1911/1915/1917 synthase
MNGQRTPSQAGRRALSFVDTIAFDGKLSLVQIRIETGRTHQIRVHLQDRTTPVYGDEIYGFCDWNKKLSNTHQIERPLLHAYTLELDHPVTRKHMTFRASMAEDMLRISRALWPNGEEERPDLFER